MTKPALFSTFLHDAMAARRMSLDELAFELDSVDRDVIQLWLDGLAGPEVRDLPGVARALRRDPIEIVAAWLVDMNPEVHPAIHDAILAPRASLFPGPTDLAVRRPSRSRGLTVSMDVGDPHDTLRE